MEKNIYSLLMVLLFLGVGSLSAQREQTRVVTVTGSYIANENESPAEAKATALNNAKKEALREAGVYEEVHSVSIVEIGGGEENFNEINFELARIELDGRVTVLEVINENIRPVNGHYEYSTTIRAKVKVEETEEDLLFDFETKGLHKTYFEGEKMTFTITPTKNCYLRIFYFDFTSNSQLYPLKNVYKDIQFEADVPITFPLPHDLRYLYDRFSTAQEYSMFLSDQSRNNEQGVLLIIALKERVPYTEEVTYENVFRWLSRIKRKDKRVHGFGVNIAKR